MMRIVQLLGCFVIVLNLGCYSYRAVPPRSAATGSEARVHMAQPQDVSLATVTVRSVVQVEGELVEWTKDAQAVLSSRSLLTRSGVGETTQGELVRIPESNIDVFEAAQPDAVKTVALAAIGAGLVAGVIFAIAASGTGGDQSGGSGNGPTPTSVIPLPWGAR
jgi:hypothetical protein